MLFQHYDFKLMDTQKSEEDFPNVALGLPMTVFTHLGHMTVCTAFCVCELYEAVLHCLSECQVGQHVKMCVCVCVAHIVWLPPPRC